MTLAEVQVKRSVILIDRLGPDIFSRLRMKKNSRWKCCFCHWLVYFSKTFRLTLSLHQRFSTDEGLRISWNIVLKYTSQLQKTTLLSTMSSPDYNYSIFKHTAEESRSAFCNIARDNFRAGHTSEWCPGLSCPSVTYYGPFFFSML